MQAAYAQKKAFTGLVGALSSLAAYGAFWQIRRYQEANVRWNSVSEELGKYTPHELRGFDAKYYPWLREGSLKNWEYRLVKLTGYFKEERFFVRKIRNGVVGYSVFAPFITAMEDNDPMRDNSANPILEYGLMVNLGWVPKENKADIEMGGEPTPPLDPVEDPDILEPDTHTLFANNPENVIEEYVVALTEVVGIVKGGEKKNILKGNVNWPYEGVYQFIDLPFMARMFRFFNYEGASQAYIERMVESYDEDSEGLYPLPATKDNFFRPNLTPKKHLEYASFLGGASLLGFVSIVLYGLNKF